MEQKSKRSPKMEETQIPFNQILRHLHRNKTVSGCSDVKWKVLLMSHFSAFLHKVNKNTVRLSDLSFWFCSNSLSQWTRRWLTKRVIVDRNVYRKKTTSAPGSFYFRHFWQVSRFSKILQEQDFVFLGCFFPELRINFNLILTKYRSKTFNRMISHCD